MQFRSLNNYDNIIFVNAFKFIVEFFSNYTLHVQCKVYQ